MSNGIQIEAIFETYKLLFNVGTAATEDYLGKLMEGANAEPDSLHTPRIAGTVINNKDNPIFMVGVKTHISLAAAYQVTPTAGRMTGVATYEGDMDNPKPTDSKGRLSWLEFDGNASHDLAQVLYDISSATCNDEDIRVCLVGGIYSGGSWDIVIINSH